MSKRPGYGLIAVALGSGLAICLWRKIWKSPHNIGVSKPLRSTLMLMDEPDDAVPEVDLHELVRTQIETINNYPSQGQVYIDATRCSTISSVRMRVCTWFDCEADVVVSVEARGMLLGNAVAQMFDVDFVPVRQQRKAPNTLTTTSARVTDTDSFRSHQTLVLQRDIRGKNVAIYDDVVSSGGTMMALARIVSAAGGNVVDMACIARAGTKPVQFNGVTLRHIVHIKPETTCMMEDISESVILSPSPVPHAVDTRAKSPEL